MVVDRRHGRGAPLHDSRAPRVDPRGLLVTLPILVGPRPFAGARSPKPPRCARRPPPCRPRTTASAAMTRALTDQLDGVQSAVAQLSVDSRLDPDSARALARLPASVRTGAMGGSAIGTPIARSVLAPTLASPEDTFGMLREVLGRLGSRLDLVRNDVERRAALAASTPSIWPSAGAALGGLWRPHRSVPRRPGAPLGHRHLRRRGGSRSTRRPPAR